MVSRFIVFHFLNRITIDRLCSVMTLGHKSTKTKEIYTHVSKRSLAKIKSPLDRILEDNKHNNLQNSTDK